MAYLTFDEYEKMGFVLSEEQFKENEPYAERHLNRITRDFYQFNSLEEDVWDYRKTKFKEAIAIQCEYIAENGKTALEASKNNPKSVGVGRLNLSFGDGQSSETMLANSLISSEVYDVLAMTGLLYRGVISR
jgi:hypothetical protein